MKYSELMVEWLAELGYTHCFFVAGGNSMHLLDGVRRRMTCIPFVHEVEAGIAVEYFNESEGNGRAFALVTAGPGLTNIVTALAGAYLESRELLVVGGQVKSTDLATGGVRQRGIQEVDGLAVAAPLCVAVKRIERPVPRDELVRIVRRGQTARKGPVFLEVCLDAQGAPVERAELEAPSPDGSWSPVPQQATRTGREAVAPVAELVREAERPLLLIGGGVSRGAARGALPGLRALGVPLQTTWNGMDRVPADEPLYFGRPNTWGQRYANVILQRADLVVALGTRLGLQQTGFNWQEFVPEGRVVQVDVDQAELEKGHPRVDVAVAGDANVVLAGLTEIELPARDRWLGWCRRVKELMPVDEAANTTAEGYLSPYDFALRLSALCTGDDVVVPCSSGGGFTVTMQAFEQKAGQVAITDKGLASMGYGLGGAIGAGLAHPDRRVVLIEGDGGFAQNLQELGTVAVNSLRLKMFLLSNEGYASIRMTQRNYFGGQYLGCDTASGLGFPDWEQLSRSFGVPVIELGEGFQDDPAFQELFAAPGPALFVVPVDPEQTYFPKISSRITETGGMESNPLHRMSPDLPDEVVEELFSHR